MLSSVPLTGACTVPLNQFSWINHNKFEGTYFELWRQNIMQSSFSFCNWKDLSSASKPELTEYSEIGFQNACHVPIYAARASLAHDSRPYQKHDQWTYCNASWGRLHGPAPGSGRQVRLHLTALTLKSSHHQWYVDFMVVRQLAHWWTLISAMTVCRDLWFGPLAFSSR